MAIYGLFFLVVSDVGKTRQKTAKQPLKNCKTTIKTLVRKGRIMCDHFFWSLRVIVIIDENICDLRGLAITTEKKQDYETTGIYIYIYYWGCQSFSKLLRH